MTRARDVANVLSTATSLATDTETAAAISSHATEANGHLPAQSGHSGKFLTTNGTSASWATSGLTNSSINSNQSLSAGYRYLVDTSAARTLTLPGSPALGDEIQIFDASGTAATYNITVLRNSGKINGQPDDALLDTNGAAVSFIYTGSAYGWRMG